MVAIFAWRLPGGATGYVKDMTAGVFAAAYLPFLASFVAAMLIPADGPRRVLTFVILTICSDIGGYFAGITAGHHKMAPAISPKKTWEGFAGSAVACLVAGWLCVTSCCTATPGRACSPARRWCWPRHSATWSNP